MIKFRLFIIIIYLNIHIKTEKDNWPDLSHVALSGEDDGLEAVVGDVQVLLLYHLRQTHHDLVISEFAVTQHSAAGLDGLCNAMIGSIEKSLYCVHFLEHV